MSERPSSGEGGPGSAPAADRGGYLGFVAHEARNPLSTALWSAELLTRMSAEDRGGARGEKLSAMCLRSLGRLRQIVEDHFLCERLDVGGIPLRPTPVQLRPLLEQLAARRPPDVGEPVLEVDPALAVSADPSLLERALEGLLFAAGGDGASVRVAARAEGERVRVIVEGARPGPEPLADPRRGSPGHPKGRALALPLARRVAVVLGGLLEVEGDAFNLILPAAGSLATAARPPERP